MARVEELPDDFDESLDMQDFPRDIPSLQAMYDQLPDTKGPLASTESQKPFEQTMREFSKTPLFMNSLDLEGDADGQNDALDAIRALQYEGTKSEIVQGFKDQGNDMVKLKKWGDAKEFYTKGIAVLTDKNTEKYDKVEDVKAELRLQKQLEEQVYANRALCNLELKNYRSTTLDCAAVLRVNPANVKAHYRSASALLALDKIQEAVDVSGRGLKIDPSNSAMKALSDKIHARSKIVEERKRKANAEALRKQKEKMTLYAALKARNIQLRGSEKAPELEDASIQLSPDPLSPESLLEFPVLLLYPLHNQSDFIKRFAEKDAIVDHLEYIFPLPWDNKGLYTVNKVDCYMDTVSGGMIKVGKKLSLLEALTNGKTEVVDGLVRIHVVPTAQAPTWIEEVKKKKGQ